MSALGHDVWLIRWITFVYSGFWGAVSGLLFVYYNKYIHPASLSITASAEGLLAVIAGGSATLAGPIVGATIVMILRITFPLHRALEHAARIRVRLHRDLYARGRRARGAPPRRAGDQGLEESPVTPALQLRELRKSFGGLPAMNGVSLQVMPASGGLSSDRTERGRRRFSI